MCRFSDAGSDELSTRSGGRRLKSAKARNLGKVGHRRCRGLYGDLAAASGWARLVRAPAPTALPRRVGVGDALNERSEGCRTGLAVSLRADFPGSRLSPSGTPPLATSFGVCFQTGPPLRSTMVSA